MKNRMKDILVLCDGEEEYAGLMTDYLKMNKELPWEIHTYTAIDALVQKEKKTEIAILLVSESAYREEMKSLKPKRLVILNESGVVKEDGICNINKYQQADMVLKSLLEVYTDIANGQLPRLVAGYKTKIIGIYSPVRRCLQTTFSLTLGQMLAEEGRTLYLNFEHYAGIPELLPEVQTRDMADLLYFLNAERGKFQLRMQAMVRRMGQLDYIPPMKSGQNLLSITVTEWLRLLQNITELEEYEYIVLDLSESMQGLFDILRVCTGVFTLIQEDRVAQCKLAQYEQVLKLYEYEDVLHKSHRCKLPQISKIPGEVEQYTRGELAKYVRKQLWELQKEGRV